MKKKFFPGCQQQDCFFSQGLWRLAGAFLTWWSAAKEGEGKRKKEMV